MNWMRITAILISAVLMGYKFNYLIRLLQEKTLSNPLKGFCGICCWIITVFMAAISIYAVYCADVREYLLRYIDILFTLIIIAIIDLKYKIIPNVLVLATILSQISIVIFLENLKIDLMNVAISAAALGILALISKASNEQLGMGDAKLITAINLIYELSFTVYSLIISMFIMLIAMIPCLIIKKVKLKTAIPFAPFYALGIAICIVMNIL